MLPKKDQRRAYPPTGVWFICPKLLAAQRLVWVNRRGEVTGTIGQPQEFMLDPRISPDGRRVAVRGTEAGKADIWIHDIVQAQTLV